MTIRYHWWATAGLFLVGATNAALAAPPGPLPTTGTQLPAVTPKSDAPANVPTLPPPRESTAPAPAAEGAPAPAAPSCAAPVAGGGLVGRTGHRSDCQAKMWGYPEEFLAPPLGAVLAANFRPMVANAQAASMVLFRMDFLHGCESLNAHGADRLARMASQLGHLPFPIVIERTPEPGLAETRRAAVLALLAREGVAVPPERVVIGPRLSIGLTGPDAMRVQQYYLINMDYQNQPVPILTQGGIGGTGAGGTTGLTSPAGGAGGAAAGPAPVGGGP
jgi:hypothetical protein